MSAFIDDLATWMHKLGALLAVLITALVCYDVIGRFAFNAPFPGTTEIAANAMVVMTFLQVPYAIVNYSLLRVTALRDRTGETTQRLLDGVAWAVALVIFGALVFATWEPLLKAIETSEFSGTDAFRIPVAPIKGIAIVLWIVSALACLKVMLEGFRGLAPEKSAH